MQKALVAHELPIICRAIQHGLGILYFEAERVTDANAMLAALGKLKPALLVIDADLPPFGGVEAIRSVCGFDSGSKKIVAILKDEDLARSVSLHRAGADEVIFGGYSAYKLQIKLRALGLLTS